MPLRRLSRWAERSVPDALKQWVTADSLIRTESFESPTWLSPDREVGLLKDYQGDGVSEYYTSVLELGEGGVEEVAIETDRPFSGVDLYLSGIAEIESASVVGEFVTGDGDVRTDSVSLACSSFDVGESFPVHLSVDEAATEADVRVEATESAGSSSLVSTAKTALLSRATHRDFVARDSPRVGMPVPVRHEETGPPIILVSVDTLRYDAREHMEPVLSALGERAVVPGEPRTNGHWTPPSHATMFTGVHPGEHKYVGVGDASEHPIHPDLVTLPELLAEEGYKCSGLVSHARVLPEAGFGRGCYRYRAQNMTNWLERGSDARTAVDRMLQWIERDRLSDGRSERLCYFLHVFDPHLPYVPDHPTAAVEEFDLAAIDTFQNGINDVVPEQRFTDAGDGRVEFDDEFVERIRSHYAASVEYTARQLRRLVTGLKTHGLFDDALVIVTGDHGEIFGEHGTYGHKSVHDPNIRPFMAVKPPAGADWTVPETPSTIDFLPTVARTVGAAVPTQCQGIAWQDMTEERSVRITERIRPDSYSIAVEEEETMAILSYPERYPERPGPRELEAGPVHEEFYRLEDLRAGRDDDCGGELAGSVRERFRDRAEEFVGAEPILERDRQRSVQASEETEEQLRHLGYK